MATLGYRGVRGVGNGGAVSPQAPAVYQDTLAKIQAGALTGASGFSYIQRLTDQSQISLVQEDQLTAALQNADVVRGTLTAIRGGQLSGGSGYAAIQRLTDQSAINLDQEDALLAALRAADASRSGAPTAGANLVLPLAALAAIFFLTD
jgi:hypothetical protein